MKFGDEMPMTVMIEYDRNGGFRWPQTIEKVGPMTRYIIGFWSVAIFKGCGINDISSAFRKDELA